MRLTLDDLSARQFELDLPGERGRPRFIKVEHLTEVRGSVERSEHRIRLHPLWLKECQVSGLDWQVERGRVSLGTPATLATLAVEGALSLTATAAPPFEGSASIGSLDAEMLAIELPGRRLSCDLRVDRLAASNSDKDGAQVALGAFALRNLQTSIGGALVRVGRLAGKSALITWRSGDASFEAANVSIRGLTVQKKDLEIEIDQVELPKGVVFRGGVLHARDLVVGTARAAIRDLSALASRRASAPGEEPPAGHSTPFLGSLSPRLLDQLHGQLDVDLTADADVRVIGRRKATHHFRVPIDHGTINYKQLERDLATLEDAVIDFEVRDGRLVLERDVPLIPGLDKPIIVWPLSDVELALAKKRVVRLRTLLNYTRPAKPPEESAEERTSFALRRLDFDNINVAVALVAPRQNAAEPQAELCGPLPRAALGDLRVTGFLHHVAQGEREGGALSIVAGALDARLRELKLGSATANAGNARVDAIEDATLTFEGLHPRRLLATFRGVRLTEADLRA